MQNDLGINRHWRAPEGDPSKNPRKYEKMHKRCTHFERELRGRMEKLLLNNSEPEQAKGEIDDLQRNLDRKQARVEQLGPSLRKRTFDRVRLKRTSTKSFKHQIANVLAKNLRDRERQKR